MPAFWAKSKPTRGQVTISSEQVPELEAQIVHIEEPLSDSDHKVYRFSSCTEKENIGYRSQ